VARAPLSSIKKLLTKFSPTCIAAVNANMESLPTHQPLLEDDTDEELSDGQIRQLLNEAAVRMRAKAAQSPAARPEAPFKLPKLKPGHIADTYEKTDGNITRLDHSKLVDKKQQAMANGIKKIEDPLAIKKQKLEVCSMHPNRLRIGTLKALAGKFHAYEDIYPIFLY
jgi:hypothetical protein